MVSSLEIEDLMTDATVVDDLALVGLCRTALTWSLNDAEFAAMVDKYGELDPDQAFDLVAAMIAAA